MTSRDFCYWLQGYFELNPANTDQRIKIEEWQIQIIKNHLAMVLKHEIDPSMGTLTHQQQLSDIHSGLARLSGGGAATNC